MVSRGRRLLERCWQVFLSVVGALLLICQGVYMQYTTAEIALRTPYENSQLIRGLWCVIF